MPYVTHIPNNEKQMATFKINDQLNWTVSKRTLCYMTSEGLQPWTEKQAVVRDDNDVALGVVSPSYELVQNEDLKQLVSPMVSEGLLNVVNTGYLNKGAKVFIQAEVNTEFQVVGEKYKGLITLLNGHTGNTSVAIGTTATRVICGNTFAMAYNEIGEKFRHTEGVSERVLSSTVVVNYVNVAMQKYSEHVETLAGTRCTESQFKQAVENIYGKKEGELRDNFVSQLNNLFYNGRGNEGKTMYDAFNAVTEYATHYSRKTADGRFNYANFGKGADLNRRAMAVLTEMATV
jgi:phage/plasmid-like protein (TIGR03299 family)